MSQVKSWGISPRSAGRPKQRVTPADPQDGRVKGELTTGLFHVTNGVGNPITLSIVLSSFAAARQTAHVRLQRVVDSRLETVLFRSIDVPAGGVRKIELTDLGGEIVEVFVSRTSDSLIPSVAVTEFFPADAGVIVHLIKSPGDFVPI